MQGFDKIILILYGAITVFFIYRLFKQAKDKKLLGENAQGFKKPISSMEMILFSILLVVGGVNFFNGYKLNDRNSMMTAVVMVVLAFVFMIFSLSKLYIAEEGMVLNSGFITFKDLKKWGFDTNRGELVMAIKKDKNTTRETVKVRKEDIEEINDLIRKYKLGK
ncbi:DUF5673 domain-containing protein [Anaerococcus degeneri]|uniref:DUF5673 domain-containing protein n=1 Tax=Anaerococcus degeneri TaxID=361500 RepID=A0ABS7YVI8_9FIRM|nr:DUF5673 domain-containing protein [Anaerococcus degeneri]MBP2015942.1 preprotein translocase subunit YajC [Anaerococcus degeneri]MCA2095688.1 DUF5673 domain-containing protein [Anaerococcus degeneri]